MVILPACSVILPKPSSNHGSSCIAVIAPFEELRAALAVQGVGYLGPQMLGRGFDSALRLEGFRALRLSLKGAILR